MVFTRATTAGAEKEGRTIRAPLLPRPNDSAFLGTSGRHGIEFMLLILLRCLIPLLASYSPTFVM